MKVVDFTSLPEQSMLAFIIQMASVCNECQGNEYGLADRRAAKAEVRQVIQSACLPTNSFCLNFAQRSSVKVLLFGR